MKTDRTIYLTAYEDKLGQIKSYLTMLKFIHNLTDSEIEITAHLISLSDKGKFSKFDKEKVRSTLNMNKNTFNVIFYRLKQKGIYEDNQIKKLLLPTDSVTFKFKSLNEITKEN